MQHTTTLTVNGQEFEAIVDIDYSWDFGDVLIDEISLVELNYSAPYRPCTDRYTRSCALIAILDVAFWRRMGEELEILFQEQKDYKGEL